MTISVYSMKRICGATIKLISFSLAVEMRKCFGALRGDTSLNEEFGVAVLCPAVLGSAPKRTIKG